MKINKVKQNKFEVRKLKAFSLIELTVSMAIVGVIMAMLSNVLVNSIVVSQKSIGRSFVREEITDISDRISNDLREAARILECEGELVNALCRVESTEGTITWEMCPATTGELQICKKDVDGNILFLSSPNLKVTGFTFEQGFDIGGNAVKKNIVLTIVGDHANAAFNVKNILRQVSISTRNYFLQASGGVNSLLSNFPSSPLPGWALRQAINVVNTSGSNQTDFQVLLNLNTATLISAGKMQSSCNDLRITASDGSTQLAYWIEPSTCNSVVTKVWAKVPFISTSGTTIYAYYGNPSVGAAGYITTDVFIREIPNVVAAWNMDEAVWNGTVGEVKDSSGNNNHGVASAVIAPGKFGNAGSFSGTTRIALAAGTNASIVGDITTEMWIRPTNFAAVRTILHKEGTYTFQIDTAGNVYWADSSNYSYANFGATAIGMVAGQWQHLVFTKTGGVVRIYLNGTLKAAKSFGGALAANASILHMGCYANAAACIQSFFVGNLDDLRIYNRALTATEIASIYGTGSDRQAYSTTNYPTKALVRKFNVGVAAGSSTSEDSYSPTQPPASPVSPLAGWSYRRRFVVSNTAGATQSNFQVMLTLNTAALVSSGKLLSSCNDLRITASDGSTLLPYWIEPASCNTANTKIWTKVSSIPSNGTDVYAYYGNAAAPNPGYTTLNVFVREISNVVAAWNMDEESGITAADSSATGATATLGSTNTFVPGLYGNALRNAATSAGATVAVGAGSPLNFTTASRPTIAFWVKLSALTTSRTIERVAAGGWGVELFADGSIKLISFGGAVVSWAGQVSADGNWHYYVITYNGGTATLYKDGILISTLAYTPGWTSQATSLFIGGDASFPLNGNLDNIRIYSAGLVAGEVTDLYGPAGGNQGYVTPSYAGKELVRKFNAGVTVGGALSEQVLTP